MTTTSRLTHHTRRWTISALVGALLLTLGLGTAQAATSTAGTPVGNVDAVTAVSGGVRVRGWAWDPSTTSAVTVSVWTGVSSKNTLANLYRADVAKVYPAAGSYRGFDVVVPTAPGVRKVCVTAKNVGAGANKAFPCVTVTVPDGSPLGALEGVQEAIGGAAVTGWAGEPDTTVPTTVRLTAGATSVDVTATATRSDIASAYPSLQGPTGFAAVLPLGLGTHEVCATALNTGTGTDTALGCRTVTVRDHSPVGTVVTASDDPAGLRVAGTAADVDAATVQVAITSGTLTATATTAADGTWTATLALPVGTHQVCATAVNAGQGADATLGCVSGTVLQHSPTGSLVDAVSDTTGLRVTGRAADLDAATVDVRLSSGTAAVTATTAADGTFAAVVPLAAGTQEVCATAVNAGQGADASLGCITGTVLAPVTVTPVAQPAPAPAPTTPGATNTGVPAGTTLRVHTGDLVVTTPNTVIDGLDVRGFVDVRATGVVIRNSIVRGRDTTTYRPLVLVNTSTASVVIEDTELAPTTPSPWIDGIRGMNITARRVNIHHVIDSVHIYGDNVLIEDSWLHDNAHFENDPAWNGTPSHDDNIQIQIGKNITIQRNSITGSKNAAVMLTQDRGLVANLTIANNFLDNGACVVNIKNQPTAPQGVSLRDNTFGRHAIYPTCGLKVPNTSYTLDLQRNYFTDGVAVKRVL